MASWKVGRSKIAVFLAGIVVILAVGGIWLGPRGLALYHQVRGGQLLAEVMKTAGEGDLAAIPCTLAPPSDEAARSQLARAISHLQAAIGYNSNLAQAYLLQGRVNCLMGEYDMAVQAYQEYTRLRPGNPLGHVELGFGYYGLRCMSPSDNIPAKSEECMVSTANQMMSEFIIGGASGSSFVEGGHQAFLARRFDVAVDWYSISKGMGLQPTSATMFLWDLAAIASGYSDIPFKDPRPFPVYVVTDTVQIEADDLQWVGTGTSAGKYLRMFPSREQSIGYFWWNGAAIAVIDVISPGNYQITINAQNTPPAPIKLQIELNFEPLIDISLEREDNSWQEFNVDCELEKGLHVIGLRFLNDEIVNGVNRDAHVSWIRVQK